MVKKIVSMCKEAKKFSGLEGSRFCEFPLFERARVLKIGARDVLYQQAYSRDGPYVLVPGYLNSEIVFEEGKKCCSVYPIRDESEKFQIEELLAAKTVGSINFWN